MPIILLIFLMIRLYKQLLKSLLYPVTKMISLTPARDGKCSTKNIYRHLSRQELIQLPQQGSRSINHYANLILQRAWKSKDLPPLIKAFTWRLIRRALATAERASRYSIHIDKHCAVCGAVEDDTHLFFHCHLPWAVWFSTSPPLRTNNLPQDHDGVQLTLQAIISTSTSNDLLNHCVVFVEGQKRH